MLAKRIYTALILICVFFVAVTQLSANMLSLAFAAVGAAGAAGSLASFRSRRAPSNAGIPEGAFLTVFMAYIAFISFGMAKKLKGTASHSQSVCLS